jgi:HD-GYP domain-containing protein (c-di-GMP phosphodiesterase class II)
MSTNPFFHRGPIFDVEYFFGRQNEIRQVLGLVAHAQNCEVPGPIKIGKTSLLLHLARPETQRACGLDPAQYAFTYLSLEGFADRTQEQLFGVLLSETLRQHRDHLRLSGYKSNAAEGLGFLDLQGHVDRLCERGVCLVYLLDEFELTADNPHVDLNFYGALRSLASRPDLCFVIATERGLAKLPAAERQVGSPFADLFSTVWLGLLDSAEAREMICRLGAKAEQNLEGEADFVWDLVNGHPLGVQIACWHMVEQLRQQAPLSEAQRRYITEATYQEAEPSLDYRWARLDEPERTVLLDLAADGDQPEPSAMRTLIRKGWSSPSAGRPRSKIVLRYLAQRQRERDSRAVEFLAAGQEDAVPSSQAPLPDSKPTIYGVVRALVKASETRDRYSRGHSDGVTRLAVAVAKEMGVPAEEIEGVKIAARLHDVGNIGLSDMVLLKPGPLTDLEREIVRTHPLVGAHILEALEFPWPVRPGVRFHHERWDGSGYPDGLIGDEIPLAARIVAVAEVFDAMTSERAYRPARRPEEAQQELREHAGARYDPAAVKALLAVVDART